MVKIDFFALGLLFALLITAVVAQSDAAATGSVEEQCIPSRRSRHYDAYEDTAPIYIESCKKRASTAPQWVQDIENGKRGAKVDQKSSPDVHPLQQSLPASETIVGISVFLIIMISLWKMNPTVRPETEALANLDAEMQQAERELREKEQEIEEDKYVLDLVEEKVENAVVDGTTSEAPAAEESQEKNIKDLDDEETTVDEKGKDPESSESSDDEETTSTDELDTKQMVAITSSSSTSSLDLSVGTSMDLSPAVLARHMAHLMASSPDSSPKFQLKLINTATKLHSIKQTEIMLEQKNKALQLKRAELEMKREERERKLNEQNEKKQNGWLKIICSIALYVEMGTWLTTMYLRVGSWNFLVRNVFNWILSRKFGIPPVNFWFGTLHPDGLISVVGVVTVGVIASLAAPSVVPYLLAVLLCCSLVQDFYISFICLALLYAAIYVWASWSSRRNKATSIPSTLMISFIIPSLSGVIIAWLEFDKLFRQFL